VAALLRTYPRFRPFLLHSTPTNEEFFVIDRPFASARTRKGFSICFETEQQAAVLQFFG